MANDDFDFVNSLFLATISKMEEQGVDSLIEEERVVTLIWHASGIIENGGFQFFYENDLDPGMVAWAYKKIGCDKCSVILGISFSLFPDTVAKASCEERVGYIQRNKELFYNLSCLFWDADTATLERLANYVRENSKKLRGFTESCG